LSVVANPSSCRVNAWWTAIVEPHPHVRNRKMESRLAISRLCRQYRQLRLSKHACDTITVDQPFCAGELGTSLPPSLLICSLGLAESPPHRPLATTRFQMGPQTRSRKRSTLQPIVTDEKKVNDVGQRQFLVREVVGYFRAASCEMYKARWAPSEVPKSEYAAFILGAVDGEPLSAQISSQRFRAGEQPGQEEYYHIRWVDSWVLKRSLHAYDAVPQARRYARLVFCDHRHLRARSSPCAL